MKYLVPLVLLVVYGCSKTPLDLAKQGVSRNIGKYLNDPSYYESVSWGSLDSAYANYENDFLIKYITESRSNGIEPSDDDARRVLAAYRKKEPQHRPIFKGYTINHTFRVRGPNKQKILMKYQFTIDTTFNIIDVEQQDIETID